MTTLFDPSAAATQATDAILHDTLHGTARGVKKMVEFGRDLLRGGEGRGPVDPV
ncbi:hypothetical protein SVIOM74S_02451 [Streptomyces violarus]